MIHLCNFGYYEKQEGEGSAENQKNSDENENPPVKENIKFQLPFGVRQVMSQTLLAVGGSLKIRKETIGHGCSVYWRIFLDLSK